MDDHRPTHLSSKPGTNQDGLFEKTKSAAGDVATHAAKAGGEVVEHAKTATEDIIDHAGEALTSMTEDMARQAPEIARRVRDQAGALADDLYHSCSEYMSRGVATYPLTSLLMAAVVGYGLGYLFSHRQ